VQSGLLVHALVERSTALRSRTRGSRTRLSIAVIGIACLSTSITACDSHGNSQHPASTSSSALAAASPSASTSAAASSSAVAGPHAGGNGVSGAISQKVPAVTRSTAAAVALTASASFGDQVTVKLTSVASSTITARAPGEVSGPGLTITVAITNGTTAAVDLSNVNVTVTDSAGLPGIVMSAGASPVRGTLATGKTVSGVYVFTVAAAHRHPVSIFVSYTADAPIVLFQGTTP